MQIFVSYRSTELQIVSGLVQDLEEMGHSVWYDQELSGGQTWWDGILEQIQASDICIFAISEGWLGSVACQHEFYYARSLNRNLLPVKIGSVDVQAIPQYIQTLQIVDYQLTAEKRFRQLVRSINALGLAGELPVPLPAPPPAPISDLLPIAEKLTQSKLSDEEQTTIFLKLKNALKENKEIDYARVLLAKLSEHRSVLAWVLQDIYQVLSDSSFSELTFGSQASQGSVRLHSGNIATLHLFHELPINVGVEHNSAPVWSPDGTLLSLRIKSDICIYNVSEKRMISKIVKAGDVTDFIWSLDGKYIYCLLSSSNKCLVNIYDVEKIAETPLTKLTNSGRVSSTKTLPAEQISIRVNIPNLEYINWAKCKFSINGEYLVLPCTDKDKNSSIILYKIQSRGFINWSNKKGFIEADIFALSPNNQRMIVGLKNGSLELWSIKEERKTALLSGHQSLTKAIAWSPKNDTVATTGNDNTIRLWNSSLQKVFEVFANPFPLSLDMSGKAIYNGFCELSWSPDGNLLAARTITDILCIFDVQKMKLVNVISSSGLHPSFSPNGTIFATYTHDNFHGIKIRFWGV